MVVSARKRFEWVLVAGLASAGCSREEIPNAPSPVAVDAGETTGAAGVPSEVLDLLRDLPTDPSEMQTLHRLAEKMHREAAACAGFADEENAELATFDELSEAHADRDTAARTLGPLMAAVQKAVVPNLVDKLRTCRDGQRGSADDAALDRLMLACFGQTRSQVPVTTASGSTAYGDPMRLPPRTALTPSDECSSATENAAARL
jgi:hypothetical protein